MEFNKWYKCHFAPGTTRSFWLCVRRLFGCYQYVSCLGHYITKISLKPFKNFTNGEATYYLCFKAGSPPLISAEKVDEKCEGEITYNQAMRLLKESHYGFLSSAKDIYQK